MKSKTIKIIVIRIAGITIILYALFDLIFGNIGPGTDIFRNWVAFFLLISGIGILILKHWSRYSTAVFMCASLLIRLSYDLKSIDYILKYDLGFELGYFLIALSIVLLFFVPKIKEQFK